MVGYFKMRESFERLNEACLCQDGIATRSLLLDKFCPDSSEPLNVRESLLQCSLLEKLFVCYKRHWGTHRICPSLQRVVEDLVQSTEIVKEKLIGYIFGENKYVSYSASKAIISYLSVVCYVTKSNSFSHDLLSRLHRDLSDGTQRKASSVLLLLEHLFLHLIADRRSWHSHAKFVKCSSCVPLNHFAAFEYLDQVSCAVLNDIPEMLVKFLSVAGSETLAINQCVWERTLRILLLAVSDCPDCHQTVMRNPSTFLEKLCLSTPVPVLNKVCSLLHKILKRVLVEEMMQKEVQSCYEMACVILKQLQDTVCNFEAVFQSNVFTGFGGPFMVMDDLERWNCSEYVNAGQTTRQSLALLYLSSLATIVKTSDESLGIDDLFTSSVIAFEAFCEKIVLVPHGTTCSGGWLSLSLISLFVDQDDALIESLLYSLEMAIYIRRCHDQSMEPYFQMWNPHRDFYLFLRSVAADHEVVLDLLISNETCFLLYFVKYLKFSVSDMETVRETHKMLSDAFYSGTGEQLSDTTNVIFNKLFRRLKCNKPGCATEKEGKIRLVDYSSEESDEEQTERQIMCISSKKDAQQSELTHLKKIGEVSRCFEKCREPEKKQMFSLQEVVTVCDILKNVIEHQVKKGIFPYNAKPLLCLLNAFVDNFS